MKFLVTFLASLVILASALAAKQPNLVFILADDLGLADTTLYGHTKFYQTPNIERLAKRGMTFTRAYSASPLCSPTRAAILTGLSPARTGITTPNCHLPQVVLEATTGTRAAAAQKSIQPTPATRLKTEYRTLAEALKDAGYATGHFGKWHLGPEPYSPLQQGFDVDLPHHPGPGPAGSYLAPWKFADFDHDPDTPDQHIEDRMAKEAVAFMEKHRDGPFFLNYWMFSVHAPFDNSDTLAGKAVFQYFPHAPGVPDWLPPAVSVHRDDWKLIRIFHCGDNGAHRYLLFNLHDDIGEKNNLAAQKPELVSELDALIEKFLTDTQAVVPVPNPAFDPAKYHPELEGRPNRKAKAPTKAKGQAKDDSDPALQGWKARDCQAAIK